MAVNGGRLGWQKKWGKGRELEREWRNRGSRRETKFRDFEKSKGLRHPLSPTRPNAFFQ